MRRQVGRLLTIAGLVCLCGLLVAGQVVKKGRGQVKAMLEMLDEIDKTSSLSPDRASTILKVQFSLVAKESDEYFAVFRGHGEFWKDAELRIPSSGDRSKFVLILHPVTPIGMPDLIAKYGDKFAIEQPNPNAGEQAMYSYTFARPIGSLRFAFKNFKTDYTARTILIDRT